MITEQLRAWKLSPMPANEQFMERARRNGRETTLRLGHEIRLARMARGLSQTTLGRRVGMSHAKIGRIERGGYVSVPLADLHLLSAAVGLEVVVRAYPNGPAVRDRAHAALLERLRSRLHPALRWSTEVPLPSAGDMRAWDAMI